MKCAFCNLDAQETFRRGKIILIAHAWCLEDRMTELDTGDWIDCLLYEDEVRNYGETRSI